MNRYMLNFAKGPVWIDQEGDCYDAQDQGPKFDAMFLHQFGCMKIDWRPDGITINWDVQTVSDEVIDHTRNWLSAIQDHVRINFCFYWSGWYTEKGYDKTGALERLEILRNLRDVAVAGDTFFRSMDIGQIGGSNDIVIKGGFEMWESANGDIQKICESDHARFYANTVHYQPRGHHDELIFTHIGIKHCAAETLPSDWTSQALGKPVWWSSDRQTCSFDRQVSPAYQRVLQTGEPVYDEVVALLPDNAESPDPIWVKYSRLIARYTDIRGAPTVVCFANRTEDVGIRLVS